MSSLSNHLAKNLVFFTKVCVLLMVDTGIAVANRRQKEDAMLAKYLIKTMVCVTTSLYLYTAMGAPTYPDGRLGVKQSRKYAKIITIPKGKSVTFEYRYSADKQNQVRIYNITENREHQTKTNYYHGSGPFVIGPIFARSMDVKYLITGYSKDCYISNRCSGRDWHQEPIKSVNYNTVRFDDSCNPGANERCTYDDSAVTWRIIP